MLPTDDSDAGIKFGNYPYFFQADVVCCISVAVLESYGVELFPDAILHYYYE